MLITSLMDEEKKPLGRACGMGPGEVAEVASCGEVCGSLPSWLWLVYELYARFQ